LRVVVTRSLRAAGEGSRSLARKRRVHGARASGEQSNKSPRPRQSGVERVRPVVNERSQPELCSQTSNGGLADDRKGGDARWISGPHSQQLLQQL
jgi:hypothetical protein